MRLTRAETRYFQACARDILASPLVRSMKQYQQHGKTTCLCHSILVAKNSFWMARQLHRRFGTRINYRAVIRGALLHDFFLYDWHDPDNGHRLHGFSHPYTAYRNASQHFTLSKMERDVIVKHMFPLTPLPPRYRESLIVSVADKICSLREVFRKKTAMTSGKDCSECPFARAKPIKYRPRCGAGMVGGGDHAASHL